MINLKNKKNTKTKTQKIKILNVNFVLKSNVIKEMFL